MPSARQSAVDEAAALVWSQTELADDARLPVDSSTDWVRLAQLTGLVLGSLLGVLVLGGALSWAMVRVAAVAIGAWRAFGENVRCALFEQQPAAG